MSEEVIKKLIEIEIRGDGEKSVKGLKKEIADLKDVILNLDKGTEEYDRAVERLVKDQRELNEVQALTKKTATALDGSYDALVHKMSLLKKEWRATNDEARRNELGQEIKEINDQLKEMDYSLGNHQRNVGNYTEGVVDGFRSIKEEIKTYKDQLYTLEEGTDEYNEVFAKLADATFRQRDLTEKLKYSTTDIGEVISTTTGVVSGIASGFGAVQGAMALFGVESEEVEKTMVKLQASLAMVQGLQGLEGIVDKIGGLKMVISGWISSNNKASKSVKAVATAVNAETVATEAHTVAMGADAVATNVATVATNTFKKALIATGIGAIVVLVGALIANWDKLTKAIKGSNEAAEETGEMSVKAVQKQKEVGEESLSFWQKLKAVIAGVGQVIYDSLIQPIVGAVKALGQVVSGDFKGAWETIKTTAVDAMNSLKGFQEGYEKSITKSVASNAREQAEIRAKNVDNYIKDMEVQSDADWKFSKEGQEAYRALFAYKQAQYEKDSDEYKEAVREQKEYERDLTEYIKEQEEERKQAILKSLDNSIKANEAKYGSDWKYTSEGMKAYADYYNRIMQLYEKDSDEYINAQNSLTTFQRECLEKRKEQAKKAQEDALKAKKKEVADFETLENHKLDVLKLTNEKGYENTQEYLDAEYASKSAVIEKEIALYKEDSDEYKALLREKEILDLEYNNNVKALNEQKRVDAINSQIAEKEHNYAIQEIMYGDTEGWLDKQYQLQSEMLDMKLALYAVDSDAYKEVIRQKELLDAQYAQAKKDKENETADAIASANKKWLEGEKNGLMGLLSELFPAVGEGLVSIGEKSDNTAQEIAGAFDTAITNTGQLFSNLSELMKDENGEATETSKAFAKTEVIISTAMGVAQAIASAMQLGPIAGPIMGAINSAVVITSGLVALKNIENETMPQAVDGANSVSNSQANMVQYVNNYSTPYVRNLTTETEDANVNNTDTKVYVLESEITETQNRQKTRLKETSF